MLHFDPIVLKNVYIFQINLCIAQKTPVVFWVVTKMTKVLWSMIFVWYPSYPGGWTLSMVTRLIKSSWTSPILLKCQRLSCSIPCRLQWSHTESQQGKDPGNLCHNQEWPCDHAPLSPNLYACKLYFSFVCASSCRFMTPSHCSQTTHQYWRLQHQNNKAQWAM